MARHPERNPFLLLMLSSDLPYCVGRFVRIRRVGCTGKHAILLTRRSHRPASHCDPFSNLHLAALIAANHHLPPICIALHYKTRQCGAWRESSWGENSGQVPRYLPASQSCSADRTSVAVPLYRARACVPCTEDGNALWAICSFSKKWGAGWLICPVETWDP